MSICCTYSLIPAWPVEGTIVLYLFPSNFFQRSIRIRDDLLLHESKATDKREQYDRMAEKCLDGLHDVYENYVQLQKLLLLGCGIQENFDCRYWRRKEKKNMEKV